MHDFLKTLRRRETVGAALVVLAAAAALAGVRLPQKPAENLRGTASRRTVAVEEVPAQRGDVAINTANAAELTAVKGVGETLAGQILLEREANGLFFYPEDLLMVRGIGEKKLESLISAFDFTVEGVSP